eukprot:3694686-Pleurochrysis_carterae.AAC.1
MTLVVVRLAKSFCILEETPKAFDRSARDTGQAIRKCPESVSSRAATARLPSDLLLLMSRVRPNTSRNQSSMLCKQSADAVPVACAHRHHHLSSRPITCHQDQLILLILMLN